MLHGISRFALFLLWLHSYTKSVSLNYNLDDGSPQNKLVDPTEVSNQLKSTQSTYLDRDFKKSWKAISQLKRCYK